MTLHPHNFGRYCKNGCMNYHIVNGDSACDVTGTRLTTTRMTVIYDVGCGSRIANKEFPSILIVNGFKMKDPTKVLEFPWKGYVIRKIVHPFFGIKEVEVFSINLEHDE